VIEPIAARAVVDLPIVPMLESTVEPEPTPLPFAGPIPAAAALDSEATRILSRQAPLPTFVLQFSTGESYTVVGSGLAGRNPRPEPGEVVDHLVTIVDPGRSVSKTHLEFGQTDGVFWVVDRFSGNGTVIHGEAGERRACAPGRRYPIARGTRVDLGEQFLIVS
jgi:pSer/pThr/pTyr-binding forkhead associated (FHA) protein